MYKNGMMWDDVGLPKNKAWHNHKWQFWSGNITFQAIRISGHPNFKINPCFKRHSFDNHEPQHGINLKQYGIYMVSNKHGTTMNTQQQ